VNAHVNAANPRRSGLLIPLFSCASTTSWGIGDIGDVGPVTVWLRAAGLRVLQLLPLNEMAPGQQSPYSAISAMAIDPIYIRVRGVPEFEALGGEGALSQADRDLLASVRAARRIEHQSIRRLKRAALRAAFERFLDVEWRPDTERARALRAWVGEQAWWIEDYSLFRALHAREGEQAWTAWPAELQRRDPSSIVRARRELADEVLFQQYLQWTAGTQWSEARARAHANDVQLFGDLPFMVDGDSADVWARRHQFRLDVSVGAPPDAFSAAGQDWGMPLLDWDVMERDDYRWLRQRARRSADLFDGYRIDHLVGFYRTYGKLKSGGRGFFAPDDEPSQLAQGERLMDLFRRAGAEIIAEDLGTVPDAVRASLVRLGVPGYRVFRWERHWHTEGQPFRDPAEYPPNSVAATGTHDTETMVVWWARATDAERRKVGDVASIQRLARGADVRRAPYGTVVRDVLLEALFASGSDLLLLPIQDAFGWSDRINTPATISDTNWTYKLPWPVDRLDEHTEAVERKEKLRAWSERYARV
jgi:4-alpha-glucanotransferase